MIVQAAQGTSDVLTMVVHLHHQSVAQELFTGNNAVCQSRNVATSISDKEHVTASDTSIHAVGTPRKRPLSVYLINTATVTSMSHADPA